MSEIRIDPGGVEDVDRLAPLWVGVRRQHRTSMPHLSPCVGDAETRR